MLTPTSTNSKPPRSASLLPSLEIEMNTVHGNWSELPGDVLALIIEKLISTPSSSLSDYIRFGAVCSSWRFIFTRGGNYEHIDLLSSRLPMLLFLYPLHIKHDDDDDKSTKKSFYSISEKKVYNFQSAVPLYKKKCVGSSHGWLITVDCDEKDYRSFQLLNPFRSFNNVITLPTLSKYLNIGTLKKFVLSADPWPSSSSKPAEDVVVMSIDVFDWLRYCRLGDKVWTSVPYTDRNFNLDVIYYKGMFYAALEKGFMLVVDVGLHPLQKPKIKLISPTSSTYGSLKPGKRTKIYLVECSGDLLHVFRVLHTVSTIRYEVYKQQYIIDNDHDSVRWVQVRDLNGFSFFLGVNASISVKAADFPGCKPDCIYDTGLGVNASISVKAADFPGCKPDCIYDTGLGVNASISVKAADFPGCKPDCIYGSRRGPSLWSREMGVFCLQDESFESHYPLNTDKSTMPPPIWIQPATQISELIKLMTIN